MKERLYYLPEQSVRTTVLVQYERWYKQERKRKVDLLLSDERKAEELLYSKGSYIRNT